MNILRQNTDYAIRAMLHLASVYESHEAVSARKLAESESIAEPFAAKIMQKLTRAGLVVSTMGPKGGFSLSRSPAKINLRDVIEAMQGPVTTNRCSKAINECPNKCRCPVSRIVDGLDTTINNALSSITLKKVLDDA